MFLNNEEAKEKGSLVLKKAKVFDRNAFSTILFCSDIISI